MKLNEIELGSMESQQTVNKTNEIKYNYQSRGIKLNFENFPTMLE